MKNWQRIGKDTVYQIGRRRIVKRRFREVGGGEINFALHLEKDTVCAMVVTPDNNVVLVRQFRPGPEMILDELPGGAIEDGEDALEAVRREVLEETGYEGELIPLYASFSCAYSTRIRHHFLIRNAVKEDCPRNDADEEEQGTEVVLKTLGQFFDQVNRGQLTDGETAYRGLRHLDW
jgi:ADP-ribose pyrophosphatase